MIGFQPTNPNERKDTMNIKMTEEERQAQLDFSYKGLAAKLKDMRESFTELLAWERYNKMVEEGIIPLTSSEKRYAKLCEEKAFLHLSGAGQTAIEFQKRIALYERGYRRYLEECREQFGRLNP